MSGDALRARFTLSVGPPSRRFYLDVDLRLERGVLVLFGPSGSGKSLTIQALAGLVRPTTGLVVVRGRTLFDAAAKVDVPAHRRGVGYVPQSPSLFPFRDVLGNVLFGLPRRERRRGQARVGGLMEELAIAHLARSRPEDLSGGERQRVALARALAVEPSLLLLDEPFASVDLDGRRSLRRALRAALARHQMPAVFVTHDPAEAHALADAAVCFAAGKTMGAGTPGERIPRAGPDQAWAVSSGASREDDRDE